MKRFFLILGLVTLSATMLWTVSANQKVIITAVVQGANLPPAVIGRNPDVDVNPLPKNSSQNYSIHFTEYEKQSVTYTVTPQYGYVNPTSGTISSYDSASGAYIHFTHLTPSSDPATNPYAITITINDGTNTVSTNVSIYAY
ncbi:MAG TPA: hypothetical protein PK765_02955 [bacterium]|nr:hypothetical protein [bacterium]